METEHGRCHQSYTVYNLLVSVGATGREIDYLKTAAGISEIIQLCVCTRVHSSVCFRFSCVPFSMGSRHILLPQALISS